MERERQRKRCKSGEWGDREGCDGVRAGRERERGVRVGEREV